MNSAAPNGRLRPSPAIKRTPFVRSPAAEKGWGGSHIASRPPEKDISRTITVPLFRCPGCGGRLDDLKTHEHIQSDLPLPKPVHTRFVTESGYCPHCRKRFRSRHPEQTSDASGACGVSVGPNAKAIAADLHHRLGILYAKVAEHFSAMAQFHVTPSGLCQSNRRLAWKLLPVYENS